MTINLLFKFLPHAYKEQTPEYGSEFASGVDLHAAVEAPILIPPGQRAVIPTGIAVQLPERELEVQVRPRSGLAFKHGVVAFFGTIDYDYRGEIQVLLFNHSDTAFIVKRGDRIAQAVVQRIERVGWQETTELDESTGRGTNGIGSTGIA